MLQTNYDKEEVKKAVNAKHIQDLHGFNEQEAWVEDKVLRLKKTPQWGQMNDSEKRTTLNILHDTFANGLLRSINSPITKDQWVDAALSGQIDKDSIEKHFAGKFEDLVGQTGTWGMYGVDSMMLAGVNFGHRMFTRAYTDAFNNALPPEGVPTENTMQALAAGFQHHMDSWFDKAADNLTQNLHNLDFFFGTHPAQNGFNGFVAPLVGRTVGELPFYLMLGEGLGAGLGAVAENVAVQGAARDTVPVLGKAAGWAARGALSLTETMQATRKGQVVLGAMRSATEGYMVGRIEGKGHEESMEMAQDWALQNTALHLFGISASNARQQYWGKIQALGGRALAYTGLEQGIARVFNKYWNIDIAPQFDFTPHAGPRDARGEVSDPRISMMGHQESYGQLERDWHGPSISPDQRAARERGDPDHEFLDPSVQTHAEAHRARVQRGRETTAKSLEFERNYRVHPHDPAYAENPNQPHYSVIVRDNKWANSDVPVREHTANGLNYKSRFVGPGEPIQVNVHDSTGKRIAIMDMVPRDDLVGNAVQGSWPITHPVYRGMGIAREMYSQVPAIAKSYGFGAFHAEEYRTDAGEGLWRGFYERGRASKELTPGRQTYYKMDFNRFAHDLHGDPATMPKIGPFGVEGIDHQFQRTPLRREAIDGRYIGRLEYMHGEHGIGDDLIVDAPHPSVKMAGHLIYNNEYHRYENARELQSQYHMLVRRAQAEMRRFDPIREQFADTNEQLLYDLAAEHIKDENGVGRRDIANFTLSQLRTLYTAAAHEITRAAETVPSASPETVAKEVAAKADAKAKTSPKYAEYTKRALTELKLDPKKVATEAIVQQNKNNNRAPIRRILGQLRNIVEGGLRTGSKEQPVHTNEAFSAGPTQIFTEEHEFEPQEGASAQLGLTPDIRAKMNSHRVANIERVRSTRQRARRFLTNAAERENRLALGSDRLASDGTRVGARDRRSYPERLSAEISEDFRESLSRAEGLFNRDGTPIANSGGIDWERNYGAQYLFHWGDRKHLPEPIVRKLDRELTKFYGEGYTYADWDRAADKVGKDLIYLAKIGAIQADGRIKIYSSSNHVAEPSIWQVRLPSEVEENELQLMGEILKAYPRAAANMHNVLKIFQNERTKAYSIEDWHKYNRMIDDAMRGQLSAEAIATLRQIRGIPNTEATPTPASVEASTPRARTTRRRSRRQPPESTVPR